MLWWTNTHGHRPLQQNLCLIWTLIAPQNSSSAPTRTPCCSQNGSRDTTSSPKPKHPISHLCPPNPPLSHSLTTPRRTEHLPSTHTGQRKGKTKAKAFEEGKSTHQQPLQSPQLHNLLCTCHTSYPDSSGSKLKFPSGWWEEGRHRAGCSFHTLFTTYQVLKKKTPNFTGLGIVTCVKHPQDYPNSASANE